MRVAFLTRDYAPTVGGISTHASNLVNGLEALGVQVEVFRGRTDIGTLFLPLRKSFDGFDVVHVQSSPYGAFVGKSPMIVTVHAPVMVELSHYSWLSMMKSAPAVIMERATFRKAKAILAVSETTANDLTSRYGVSGERVTVIGNGVNYEKFSVARGRKKPNVILLVSRLEPRKGVSVALRALAGLTSGTYEARVAGDGSQRRELEQLAKSLEVNASFLGFVTDDTLLSNYGEAGVFLTTSHSEGFGLSLLEAMSAGCAVIASDIPTHRGLVTNGRNGLIYANSIDLTKKLGFLLSNPEEATRLGRAAAESASKFSWDKVVRKVHEAYEKCLQ